MLFRSEREREFVLLGGEDEVRQFLSANWRDLLLTMLLSMTLNQPEQKLRTDIRLQLSVPVRPDLPVQEILQKQAMM